MSEFHKCSSIKDGHKGDCKSCRFPTIQKVCVMCGTPFMARKLWDHTRDTCSDQCKYDLLSVKLSGRKTISHPRKSPKDPLPPRTTISVCQHCGTEFEHAANYDKKFCSKECRKQVMSKLLSGSNNPCWKETKKLRRSSKRSLVKRIKNRDRVCVDCGLSEHLQVHHVDSNPDNNDEPNLVLLCKVHHAKRHIEMGEPNVAELIMSNRTYSKIEPRHCIVCDTLFQPNRNGKKCCSAKCSAVQTGRTRHAKTLRICLFCGKEYSYGVKDQKYCSHKCVGKSQMNLNSQATYQRVCKVCGTSFMAKRKQFKFCSKRCWRNHINAQRRIERVFLRPDKKSATSPM